MAMMAIGCHKLKEESSDHALPVATQVVEVISNRIRSR